MNAQISRTLSAAQVQFAKTRTPEQWDRSAQIALADAENFSKDDSGRFRVKERKTRA